MNCAVRCPLQYWKVCVLIRKDGAPSATVFILGQSEIKDLPGFEETIDVAATQIRIVDLEKKTKLDFGAFYVSMITLPKEASRELWKGWAVSPGRPRLRKLAELFKA